MILHTKPKLAQYIFQCQPIKLLFTSICLNIDTETCSSVETDGWTADAVLEFNETGNFNQLRAQVHALGITFIPER